MNDRERFAKQYRQEVEPIDIRKFREPSQRETARRRATRQEGPKRYMAPKGTMQRAKKRKKRPNTKIAALILAAAIGVGGISLINNYGENRPEPLNIIEMQENGVNPQSLGLSAETIELFEKYDEYFENFDPKNQYNLTDEQILSMIDEIREMHFSAVKEKMGDLVGEDPKNIKLSYKFDRNDGTKHSAISINEDNYTKREVYSNNRTWPFPTKNYIPEELSNIIWQLEDLEDLASDVKTDKITKVNAVKKLETLYEALEQVATGEFIKDEKGNISIMHDEGKQKVEQEKERE